MSDPASPPPAPLAEHRENSGDGDVALIKGHDDESRGEDVGHTGDDAEVERANDDADDAGDADNLDDADNVDDAGIMDADNMDADNVDADNMDADNVDDAGVETTGDDAVDQQPQDRDHDAELNREDVEQDHDIVDDHDRGIADEQDDIIADEQDRDIVDEQDHDIVDEQDHDKADEQDHEQDAENLNDDDTQPAATDRRRDRDEDEILSELDEDQFEDYDPVTANIQDRPVAIDADAAQTLKASKRKRADGDGAAARKAKTGRREKRARRDGGGGGGDGVGGDSGGGGRSGRGSRGGRGGRGGHDGEGVDDDSSSSHDGGYQRRPRKREPAATSKRSRPETAAEPEAEEENEENLTPEERRKRAISRALEAAAKANKNSTRRRKKKDDIDLEDAIDDELSDLKVRMEKACEADNAAVSQGQPAVQKLNLLPEVTAMLNRSNARDAVLDPETTLLRHVRFFLEPLPNGVLPAYNIQRDLITAMTRLPIRKETLISSQIGGLILFYTQSRQPQAGIKRMAQRLVEDWSRPVLNRSDSRRERAVQTRTFDVEAAKLKRSLGSSQFSLAARPAKSAREAERQRLLAPINSSIRSRLADLPASYTIAPQSTFEGTRGSAHRPIGAAGADAFRRIALKNKKR